MEDKYEETKRENIPKAKLIDLEKLKESQFTILKDMIEANLIDEQGIRISGQGLVIRKLDELIRLTDKTNLKLHFIEKKLGNS